MKGIVVEIDRNHSVILSDDGLFMKIENQNYEIGQTININNNQVKKPVGKKWIAGMASVAAAVAFCTVGVYAWFTPANYVSLDVNPSVEYTVNRFDRVLDVKAVNDDGEKILEDLSLGHQKIEEAVIKTLEQLIEEGFLSGDPDSGIIVATSHADQEEAEQLAGELKHEIRNYLDEQVEITAEVKAEAVGLDRVSEARMLGVTPGKLNLVEELQASTVGAINKEEWLKRPVKEINKAIRENQSRGKDKESWEAPWKENGKQQETRGKDKDNNRKDRVKSNGPETEAVQTNGTDKTAGGNETEIDEWKNKKAFDGNEKEKNNGKDNENNSGKDKEKNNGKDTENNSGKVKETENGRDKTREPSGEIPPKGNE